MSNTTHGARMTSIFEVPVASARVIEQGDELYWDAANNQAEPYSQQTDNATEERNQAEAALNRLGVAYGRSNDGDTTVLVDIGGEVQVLDFTVPSAVYRFGTLLGPSEANSGTALENQQLEAVTSYDLATHIVMSDSASARTTVPATPIKSYIFRARGRMRGQVNTETLAGAKTLTHDDVEVHYLDPGGASRNVDLPAEQESSGLGFVIFNTADAAENLVVRDDAGATIGVVAQGQGGRFDCNGTVWRGIVSGDGSETALVNTETLSGNRTITTADAQVQFLDPGGANRNVDLPAEASSDGLHYLIFNAADADEDLVVRDDTPTTVITIRRGGAGEVWCDGTTWRGRVTNPRENVNRETLAGAKTLTTTDAPVQFLDPGGADRIVTLPAEADSEGLSFAISNIADAAGEELEVRDDGGTTILHVSRDGTVVFRCDGTSWEASPSLVRERTNTETLGAAKTLTGVDARIQFLDPGGANRNVDLPAEASSDGLVFEISNTADAAENLVVRDDTPTTILTIRRGGRAVVWCDGTTWRGLVVNTRKDFNTQTLSGDLVLTTSSAELQFLDPGGAGRNVDLPAEADSEGLSFVIVNDADMAEDLTVRDDGAATIVVVSQNETGHVFCNGTVWRGFTGQET